MHEADPMVETIIRRLTEVLTEHFDARHDALEQRMAALERLTATGVADIKRDAAFTRAMAQGAFGELDTPPPEPETPAKDTPRPLDIDRATSSEPSDGPQRVDLCSYGTVAILRPGADPATVWDGLSTIIREERGYG